MPDYSVTWEIEVSADTPHDAAKIAREAQIAPNTLAVVFDVYDADGEHTRVDLIEGTEDSNGKG